jgi:hypothetical protein
MTIRWRDFHYTPQRTMRAKEIFGVAVRLIGLVCLYQGLAAVPTAVASICPVFPHFYFRNLLPSLFMVGWPLLVGYWLVRGARWLVRLAYPEEPEGHRTAMPAAAAAGPKPSRWGEAPAEP